MGDSYEYELVFIGFRHVVIIRQVAFSIASSLSAFIECSHIGQVYSAAEWHSGRADDLSVVGVAPHVDLLVCDDVVTCSDFFLIRNSGEEEAELRLCR